VKRPAPHPGGTKTFRLARVSALTLVLLFLGSGPAYADAAEPSNYEAAVTALDPRTDVVTLEVVGGDAFLQVKVAPGHELLVPGYSSEPYIRVDADGSVWINEDSPTRYINEDRFGRVETPPDADGKGEPRWTKVADNGRYAWHDHRTHWMSFDRPPNVVGDVRQLVFPWKLPIQVDGQEVTVEGHLEWVPSRSPAVPILIGIAALFPLLALRRRSPTLAVTVGVTAIVAIVVDLAQNAGTPASARGFPFGAIFPVIALGAGAVAVAMRKRERVTSWAVLIGALTLMAWAVMVREVLWLPVLPSPIPSGLERAAVALILWAGIGVLALWAVDFRRSLSETAAR